VICAAEGKPELVSRTSAGVRVVRLLGERRGIELLSAEAGAEPREVQYLNGALPQEMQFGARACLSQDGQILTIENTYPVPFVFDLGWRTFKGVRDGVAAPTQIKSTGPIEDLPQTQSNVLSPKVTGISPVDPKTGQRKVWFDVAVPMHTAPISLVSRYYEGYAVPQRVGRAPRAGTSCVRISDAKEGNLPTCTFSLGDGYWLVSNEAPPIQYGEVTFRSSVVRIYSTSGDLTAVQMSDDAPLVDLTFFAPPIKAASMVAEAGERAIYMEDESGDQWRLTVDAEASRLALSNSIGKIKATDRAAWKWSHVCASQACGFKGLPE
jgi:hypothetical protein